MKGDGHAGGGSRGGMVMELLHLLVSLPASSGAGSNSARTSERPGHGRQRAPASLHPARDPASPATRSTLNPPWRR